MKPPADGSPWRVSRRTAILSGAFAVALLTGGLVAQRRSREPENRDPFSDEHLPAAPDPTDEPVEVVHCAGWDAASRSPVSPMSQAVARAQDAAGGQYAVVVPVGGVAWAVVEVCWAAHHAEVWFRRRPWPAVPGYRLPALAGRAVAGVRGAGPALRAGRAGARRRTDVAGSGAPPRRRGDQDGLDPHGAVRWWHAANLAGLAGPASRERRGARGRGLAGARRSDRTGDRAAGRSRGGAGGVPVEATAPVAAAAHHRAHHRRGAVPHRGRPRPDGEADLRRDDPVAQRKLLVADPGRLHVDAAPLGVPITPGQYAVDVFQVAENGKPETTWTVACRLTVTDAPVTS